MKVTQITNQQNIESGIEKNALLAYKPVVAIIGRQNVGKSTLLNRVAGKPIAIVEDLPGTTRDRIIADASWSGVDFVMVDTGGLEFKGDTTIARGTRKQAEMAINEADLIIFLVDAKEGLFPLDMEIANLLRKTQKPVVLVVNKVDNDKMKADAAEFYQLGFSDPIYISAFHGKGVADLLDKIIQLLPPQIPTTEPALESIKVAIVGRPHVGKSLLLNTLLGQERSIVGTAPGTTRDAIDSLIDFEGQNVLLIDTAGIRRKGRQDTEVEWYSVLRAMRAIDRADIALLIMDATEMVTAQDTHIAGYIQKAAKGIILLINKWDLVTEKNRDEYTEYIRERLKFASYAPVHFISAKTGQGTNKIMPMVKQIYLERTMRLDDTDVNNVVQEAVSAHVLPRIGNKPLKVYSAAQTAISPPTFSIYVNNAKMIHFSYHRYLENKLRQAFGFNGTPIRLVFKVKG